MFLADTWWFGLTKRLPDEAFLALAKLRASQGFTAVQLVVGIPPEVGVENENAQSPYGAAWQLNGVPNLEYLAYARSRVQQLNQLGLQVIVYGAWGHQIEWIGVQGMARWWQAIIKAVDDLDVTYCLTGESNLWVGQADCLLPDKTTRDLKPSLLNILEAYLPESVYGKVTSWYQKRLRPLRQEQLQQRKHQWSELLQTARPLTTRPFFIHTRPHEISEQVVENPQLLTAVTVQTGHNPDSKNRLWQLAANLPQKYNKPFINLEPWYEGILGQFHTMDQLYAYWVTMLAGAASYCYGAHGIWNVGDGHFLAQWGEQSFAEAMALDTPRLLGLSHKVFLEYRPDDPLFTYELADEQLVSARLDGKERTLIYYPRATAIASPPHSKLWIPEEGIFVDDWPQSGSVVVITN